MRADTLRSRMGSLNCNARDKLRKCVLHAVNDYQEFAALCLEHAFGDAVIKEDQELIVEALNIEQKDGLGMDLEGVPGEDFEEFLKGTEATG
jgi:hypothetical protein